MDKDLAKAFGRFDNGFTLTFENGLVLSTRFGPENYCDNHAWLTRSADCDNHENWSEWTKENSHMASESMDNLFSDHAYRYPIPPLQRYSKTNYPYAN